MLINLSEVLTEQHRPINQVIGIDLEDYVTESGTYSIIEKSPMQLSIEHVSGKELLIKGSTELTIEIPCDRCLDGVKTKFVIDFANNVDLSKEVLKQEDELDEKNYIDGYNLDVDKLLYNEILIGWPMKILCCDDCKGICNACGQNLNEGTCGCEDTSLDPRMSVIRDVFKNFKEV